MFYISIILKLEEKGNKTGDIAGMQLKKRA